MKHVTAHTILPEQEQALLQYIKEDNISGIKRIYRLKAVEELSDAHIKALLWTKTSGVFNARSIRN